MANITRVAPFDDLRRGFFVRPVDFEGAPAQPPAIKIDVKEQADSYLIHADLPGVRKEDIHVVVNSNQASIRTEVKQEKSVNEGERLIRCERYFGKVSRSFQLGPAPHPKTGHRSGLFLCTIRGDSTRSPP